jgi:V8-like Glu-specific endopeptidase
MTPRLALGAIALIALALPSGALAQPHARAADAPAAASSQWSAERMANARPLELIRGRGDQMRLRRAQQVPFTSAEVPDPTVNPNSTTGRLFGRLEGVGDYSCSATVLDTQNGRVIMTAGHCVYEPQLGRFATDLSFVPAYTDGNAPFGIWTWQSVLTTRQWASAANTNFDYATVKLREANDTPIEEVVGGRLLKTNVVRNQGYAALGYPVNLSDGQRLWACFSSYAGKDPHPFRRGKPPSGIGCDMTSGASGGGWVNSAGRLVSLTSFGYKAQPNIVFGPYLTVQARQLVARQGQ